MVDDGVGSILDARLTAYFDQYADPQYDLWHGGTAKGRLLDEHYGRDGIFRDRFPQWREPFVEKAEPFDYSLLEKIYD